MRSSPPHYTVGSGLLTSGLLSPHYTFGRGVRSSDSLPLTILWGVISEGRSSLPTYLGTESPPDTGSAAGHPDGLAVIFVVQRIVQRVSVVRHVRLEQPVFYQSYYDEKRIRIPPSPPLPLFSCIYNASTQLGTAPLKSNRNFQTVTEEPGICIRVRAPVLTCR